MKSRVDFTDIDQSRDHDITIEEVKACDIFAHLNDEQALEVIDTIKRLSVIMFNSYQKEPETFGKKSKNS